MTGAAPTNPPDEARHVVEHEIATEHHDENGERAEPHWEASTIESAPATTSAQEPIASPTPSYEGQSLKADERESDAPRGTRVGRKRCKRARDRCKM